MWSAPSVQIVFGAVLCDSKCPMREPSWQALGLQLPLFIEQAP